VNHYDSDTESFESAMAQMAVSGILKDTSLLGGALLIAGYTMKP